MGNKEVEKIAMEKHSIPGFDQEEFIKVEYMSEIWHEKWPEDNLRSISLNKKKIKTEEKLPTKSNSSKNKKALN